MSTLVDKKGLGLAAFSPLRRALVTTTTCSFVYDVRFSMCYSVLPCSCNRASTTGLELVTFVWHPYHRRDASPCAAASTSGRRHRASRHACLYKKAEKAGKAAWVREGGEGSTRPSQARREEIFHLYLPQAQKAMKAAKAIAAASHGGQTKSVA